MPLFIQTLWSTGDYPWNILPFFTLHNACELWITSIFRYGPWMDTNLAVPLGSTKCKVVFDYFLDKSLLVQSISLAHVPIYVLWYISGGMPGRCSLNRLIEHFFLLNTIVSSSSFLLQNTILLTCVLSWWNTIGSIWIINDHLHLLQFKIDLFVVVSLMCWGLPRVYSFML